MPAAVAGGQTRRVLWRWRPPDSRRLMAQGGLQNRDAVPRLVPGVRRSQGRRPGRPRVCQALLRTAHTARGSVHSAPRTGQRTAHRAPRTLYPNMDMSGTRIYKNRGRAAIARGVSQGVLPQVYAPRTRAPRTEFATLVK